MSTFAYRRQQDSIAVKGALSNGASLKRILVPARREVQIFGIKAVAITPPTSGLPVLAELVSSTGALVATDSRVNISTAGASLINESSASFPIIFRNSKTTDDFINLRLSGATQASTEVDVIIDYGVVGIKGKPA